MKRVVLAACNAYVVRLDARGVSFAAKRSGIAGSRYVRWLVPLPPPCGISPAARGGRVLLDLLPYADLNAVAGEAGGTRAQVATIAIDGRDRYDLVVPRDVAFEGSYGRNGADRPPGATACAPRPIGSCP